MLILTIGLLIIAFGAILVFILSIKTSKILTKVLVIAITIVSLIGAGVSYQATTRNERQIATTMKSEKKKSSKKKTSRPSSFSSSSMSSSNSSMNDDSAQSSSTSSLKEQTSSSSTVTSSSTTTTSPSTTTDTIKQIKDAFSNQVSVSQSNNQISISASNSDLLTQLSRIASHNQDPSNFDSFRDKLVRLSKDFPSYTIELINPQNSKPLYSVKDGSVITDNVY